LKEGSKAHHFVIREEKQNQRRVFYLFVALYAAAGDPSCWASREISALLTA
jgi:hypothetical protein